MLTDDRIDDLIYLRMPEGEARALLAGLTPEQTTAEDFNRFVARMQQTAIPVPALETAVMDCCGTGGSGLSHYNTSTTMAFVLAAGDVPMVKFGNRSVTGRSGSFDFLERLGLPVQFPLEAMPDLLNQCGLVFLFAPQVYPALGPLTALRKTLAFPTIFNFMGPVLNPVQPAYRVLGVSSAVMQPVLAQYLAEQTATQRALVVRGEPTLDELHAHGESRILEVDSGEIRDNTFRATYSGQHPPADAALSVEDNLAIFHRLVSGEDSTSYYHLLVCLNAGAGFYAVGKAASIEEGRVLAETLLREGAVKHTLDACRRAYQ